MFRETETNEDHMVADNFKRNPKLKPEAKLVGANGNIFNLLAICSKSLRRMPNAYNELWGRVQKSGSYDEALQIIMEYVEVI